MDWGLIVEDFGFVRKTLYDLLRHVFNCRPVE